MELIVECIGEILKTFGLSGSIEFDCILNEGQKYYERKAEIETDMTLEKIFFKKNLPEPLIFFILM